MFQHLFLSNLFFAFCLTSVYHHFLWTMMHIVFCNLSVLEVGLCLLKLNNLLEYHNKVYFFPTLRPWTLDKNFLLYKCNFITLISSQFHTKFIFMFQVLKDISLHFYFILKHVLSVCVYLFLSENNFNGVHSAHNVILQMQD